MRQQLVQQELFTWTYYFTVLQGNQVGKVPSLYEFRPTKKDVLHSPYLFIWRLDYDLDNRVMYWTELRTSDFWEVSAPSDEMAWCERFLAQRASELDYQYKIIDTQTKVELRQLHIQHWLDKRLPRWDQQHLYSVESA